MNNHLHAAGFLERMRSGEPASRKIWEAVQTLFSAMNEIQELMAVRLETKTKVLFTSPPALQFGRQRTVYADG